MVVAPIRTWTPRLFRNFFEKMILMEEARFPMREELVFYASG
jgi:hypothetical protein